jgi:hypothetical protein
MEKQINKIVKLPDPLASIEVKLSNEYGLSVAELISNDWFGGAIISGACDYLTRRDYVRKKRLFVRGEHDLDYFKKQMFKGENDLDFINLDWSNINWAEKFCRIVSNGLDEGNYKLDVRATDKLAALKKSQKEDYYLKYMKSKPMLEKAKQVLGIDLMPKSFIPEDEEEMKLYMEIKDRPKIEIAEEILIDFVLNTNEWQFISGQFNKDLVDVGLIIARVYTDKNDGVKVGYVDPENYIHSRVTRNDFADKYYEGYVDTITLSDLKRESDYDDTTLRKIAKSYSGSNATRWVKNYDTCNIDDLLNYKIDILRFAYKTSKKITYKKKIRNGETIKVSKKDDNYIAPERKDTGVTSGDFDTWFEGNYVIGTKYLYDWKECENNFDDIMNKAMSPFITMAYDIYENRLRSFTDNIEAPSRQLQKISLKIQHLINELTPDLKEVDLDQLAELDDGKGGVKRETWETALSLMGAKGVIFKKRINMGEDGIKDSPAARPLPSQQGSALGILLNTWAHYYNLIRENTGVNPARDGSMPADALVGVNQMAQLASNTVTRNIVDTSVLFKKKICENISTRIHTIFSYKEAKKIRDVYENVVGKNMLDAMEVLKDRNLHEFGFTFEMMPTAEEIRNFNDILNLAIQEQNIDVEIVFQTRQLAKVNIKKSIEYLMYHRRKSIKQRQEERMMFDKNKSEGDAMAAQAKVQAETMAYQSKRQVDLQYESQLAQIEIMKMKAIKELEIPYADKEFQQDVYLKKIDSMSSLSKEEYREDRKNERTKIQATQQSKMIDQRNKDKDPIDFENKTNWFNQLQ